MKIQLIRNATMKIFYAGRIILTDPMLSPKDEIDPFAGKARNPTVELPFPVEEVLNGVDAVLLSHLHQDHYDRAAEAALPKTIPLFCQPGDEIRLAEEGFGNTIPIPTSRVWEGTTLTRTEGEHGRGDIQELMGNVSGFVFQAAGEPTVYWAGDTIWCPAVERALETFKPDLIITHSGGAKIPGYDYIVMDGQQTLITAGAAPEAIVVAVHMEALDHCEVSRAALRQMADQADIAPGRLMIPNDGETIVF